MAIFQNLAAEVKKEAEVYMDRGVLSSPRPQEYVSLGSSTPARIRTNKTERRGPNVKQAIKTGVVRACAGLAFILACKAQAAAPGSEKLLPATTVAYVSIANADDFEQRFKQTQIGQFAQDESLKPFIDHLKKTVPKKLGDIEERVGVSLQDLQNIASGELAWGIVNRETGRAASILVVDTTGNDAQRDEVIKKLDEYLVGLKATKSTSEAGGITIQQYDVPPQGDDKPARTAAYFVHENLLCVSDNAGAVAEVAGRMSGSATDAVDSIAEYQAVLNKCQSDAGIPEANVTWFVRPFPLADAIRTIRPRTREGEDRVEQLRKQGFDAVKAVGGLVNVAPDPKHDFIHRTAVFAPPVKGAPEGQKYLLGMNIFKTPNSSDLTLHNWTPRMIARYTTVNIDLLNAFDNIDTVFDSMIAGYEGAFKTAMDRFKDDPFGPRIDFRNDIVASLGTRVCMMTDYTLPIETDSERFMLAIDVKPEKAETLKVAIGKYLEKDGYLKKDLEGREIWEFQPEEVEEFDIGLDDGALVPEGEGDAGGDERLLTRSAVCVDAGQLFIASDVEFLRLAFKQASENESLAESFDYIAVKDALAKLAPKEQCSWSFTRTDETIRPTYVMLNENRLPQSESFFARLLNELLTTPADQKNQLLREQKLDGRELPSYELARRYFGPSGRSVRADEDGWLMTGVLLNKAEN
ncbi:hypothetical protein [Aeoliella sp. SH292]|uniref:hypothetical protein n=1 Tax=Aeoliella sp. SH292 TaxID=3454464 RepID=UPI003F99C800